MSECMFKVSKLKFKHKYNIHIVKPIVHDHIHIVKSIVHDHIQKVKSLVHVIDANVIRRFL